MAPPKRLKGIHSHGSSRPSWSGPPPRGWGAGGGQLEIIRDVHFLPIFAHFWRYWPRFRIEKNFPAGVGRGQPGPQGVGEGAPPLGCRVVLHRQFNRLHVIPLPCAGAGPLVR